MSCSSNSRTAEPAGVHGQPVPEAENQRQAPGRRRCLQALLLLTCLGGRGTLAGEAPPWPGLRRWGRGELRRFGLLVYEASLWAGDDPLRPPYALRLDYRRDIPGRLIGEASLREMRQLGADEAQLTQWAPRLQQLFPDVRSGDHITGIHRGSSAWFSHNGRFLGEIAEPGFADAFFAIWLDPRSSAPALRQALLARPER
jgi:hypothetical protein